MSFIQIVEFTTSDFDAVQRIDEAWLEETKGKRTARRQIVTRDRNSPERYVVMVFFDSYESAMANSALPETAKFAEQYQSATTSVAFHDLDVLFEQEL